MGCILNRNGPSHPQCYSMNCCFRHQLPWELCRSKKETRMNWSSNTVHELARMKCRHSLIPSMIYNHNNIKQYKDGEREREREKNPIKRTSGKNYICVSLETLRKDNLLSGDNRHIYHNRILFEINWSWIVDIFISIETNKDK